MLHPHRVRRWGYLLACTALLWAAPVPDSPGATVEQVARLTAWDAQAGDGFGASIAVGQQTALVGAPNTGDTPSAGSVYVYNLNTGGIGLTLNASDSSVGDRFGSALAVYNNTAIVGAEFGGSDVSALAGAAYLFDLNTGNELTKLTTTHSEALDGFGMSVAINGTSALVGAPTENTQAGVDAGAAHVFDVATGNALTLLHADDAQADAHFGASVSLAGGYSLIGAPQDSAAVNQSGAAYLFDTLTGSQLHKLTPNDPRPEAHFGQSVASNTELAVIGAPVGGSTPGSGAAYVFDINTGEQLYKLTASDTTVGDHFGMSVAVGQDIAVIGAILGAADESSLAGAAYVFDLDTGEQLAKINASDTQAIDYFGGAVTVMNNTAAIGARGNNTADGVDAGAAYLFDISQPVEGDLDGDGFVGINDLNLVFANWNLSVPHADPLADVSGDGFVGIDDVTLILSNWNLGTPPYATSLPEPGTLIYVALFHASLLRRRCG